MSNGRTRRHYATEKNAEILRRHLVDKVPVSELRNEQELQPSVFYQWQRQVHKNLVSALTPVPQGPSRREQELEAENARLKAQLGRKDSVIAEIAEEYTRPGMIFRNRDESLGYPRYARRGRRLCSRLVGHDRHQRRTVH